jgi:hypothetical protein
MMPCLNSPSPLAENCKMRKALNEYTEGLLQNVLVKEEPQVPAQASKAATGSSSSTAATAGVSSFWGGMFV